MKIKTKKIYKKKWTKIKAKQAGAELGQAQLKLGLNFTLIFCRFGFSGFGFYFIGWIEKIGLVYLVLWISNILLGRLIL